MTVSDTQLHALDGVLDDHVGRAADGGDADTLAADLSAVVDALSSSVALRRAVTDPGADQQRRQALTRAVLDGKVSRTAVDVAVEATGMRWSNGQTFVAALERQAVRARLLTADRSGTLDETEIGRAHV